MPSTKERMNEIKIELFDLSETKGEIDIRIKKLSEEYENRIKFCRLNVDGNPQTATKYQVMSIPLLLFFKGEKMVDSSLGAVPERVLRPKVEALLQ